MSKKKKKDKVTYYDDNSTVVDMSRANRKGEKQEPPKPRQQSSFHDKWVTYWRAVRKMLVPMCVVLLILCVLYFLAMYLGGNF